MKNIRLIAAGLLLALLAVQAPARADNPLAVVDVVMATDYALDSTSYVYPQFAGKLGQVLNDNISTLSSNATAVKTAGSSVTVTTFTAAAAPFANVAVGDLITLVAKGSTANSGTPPGTRFTRYVLTRADANNITISGAAIDISDGASLSWRKFSAGSTAADGWIPVDNLIDANFIFQIDQANTTTGIDYKVECKGTSPTATPVIIIGPITKTNAQTPYAAPNVFTERWAFCRLGIKITSTDDGGDLTTNEEKISIEFIGKK